MADKAMSIQNQTTHHGDCRHILTGRVLPHMRSGTDGIIYISMKRNGADENRTFQKSHGERMSGIQNTHRAFAVLNIQTGCGSASPDTIKTRCEGIPGIGAVRIDADRGKIHILYDGTISAIEQVEHALQILGHTIRYPEAMHSSSPPAQNS